MGYMFCAKLNYFQIIKVPMLYLAVHVKIHNLDKNGGFVKEDNSGKSNIFSTGEKAIYSYSPAAEKEARQGLGGLKGLIIISLIVFLVGISTISVYNQKDRTAASNEYLKNLDNSTAIASRLR